MNQSIKYQYGYHILRVGIAITFLWIGVLILRSPENWGAMMQPWAFELLPFSLKEAMITTAILDILVGFLLLINVRVWLASLLGSLHLASVLIVVGIDPITVRDIGLLAGTLALMATTWPEGLVFNWKKS